MAAENKQPQVDLQQNTNIQTKDYFPVIGMGGSAGSFNAFESFFLNMPPNSDMAFVVVMHLSTSQDVNVAELFQSFTSMPVIEAHDGVEVERNKIYIIPPLRDMGIHNRTLLLFKASRTKGAHMSIDHFFQSLAEDQWNNAVGIVFSGMGTDGETGVRMIKEKLGMVMVQDPETADFKSMPETSIKTNLVDYILSPEDMPGKLIKYLTHPAIKEPYEEDYNLQGSKQTCTRKIIMLLRSHTGHDFSLYKKNTVSRRIERRIAFHQLPDYEHYVNFLRENPEEVEILFKELLIGVTKFFRDQIAFEKLKRELLRQIKQKTENDSIRVWVAGCSTGEEAYSIAIILMELLETLFTKNRPKVQIFATDLDAIAIDVARIGFYFANIASEVSPQRLDKYFIKKNNGFVVKKELRDLIVFAQHNLIKDAPFTRLDLLSCRNLMIYLTTELQSKIIPVFHYSLNVDGVLFLGPAESLGGFADSFQSSDTKWKLYNRKEGPPLLGTKLDFPFHITQQSSKIAKADVQGKPALKNLMSDTFNKVLLQNYAPTALLLSEKGEILYINGRTSKYLEINTGEAVMDFHKMIREELKYAVGSALHQAFANKSKIQVNDVRIKENGKVHLICFTVEYLNDFPLSQLLLLTFVDKGPVRKRRTAKEKGLDPTRDSTIIELEKELTYTKQQLHTTIEQMETSLEELKSTNEELQSTNEELQSTNEEALTTKEEMQSLNEELMTLNHQYQTKAEELSLLNNDMKNLLDNTDIGTIFLDNDLNILRFTPQVTKLFNLISTDVGRSITHIASNFEYSNMEETILEVIERLTGKSLEVMTKNGDWYNMRVMPYRTTDNFISGAVLTFTRITPVKSMEVKISSLLTFTQSIIEQISEPCLLLDKNKKILAANHRFYVMFGLRDFEVIEHSFLEIVNNLWNTQKLNKLFSDMKNEIYIVHDFGELGVKNLIISSELQEDDMNRHNGIWKVLFKAQ
ncbi:MAG TPA: CheR family methyltransferase [Sphingobacteriaceae bacterium]|nr:CheR family methyltransferase [Sphingobacteriaceae bacterium]